jgi:Ca2+-binding EF-hand superfamily protein
LSANIDVRELFTKEILRVAEPDGIHALLADLDDDEDGMIFLNSLMRLLRREDVFVGGADSGDTSTRLTEAEVRALLEPFKKGSDDQLNVVALIRFIEKRDGSSQEASSKAASDEIDMKIFSDIIDDYAFSNDVEVRALEKKIRNVGRTLSRRGIDVEELFRRYDTRESGMIRRTEFIEALSQIGTLRFVARVGAVVCNNTPRGVAVVCC